tara:strand:+ start:556 stop:1341 length:786 start_codon:yes stop_codon:yes gene_type:complete
MSILLHGDCLELMKTLDDDSVDLIFCDLPYSCTNCSWDVAIDLDKFWIEVMRIKKLHTPIFMTTTTKFGVSLINSCPKKCPFRYDIVWLKSSPAGFLSAKTMPMRKHEMIYVFYEKLPFYDLSSHKHKFLKEGKIEPNKEKTQISQAQKGGCDEKNKKNMYGASKGGTIGNVHGTNYDPPLPVSILEIKSTRGKHSTEKPVALMSWILKYYSKEGDVVLDPTMGSGSTGVSCKEMNRNFIGIEKDPEIYEVAVNRIEYSFV